MILLSACSDNADEAPPRGSLTVVVDVFSGRPNPSFELTVGEAERLEELVAGLVPMSDDSGPPTNLGFRGFVVAVGDLAPGSLATPDGVWTPDGRGYVDPNNQVFRYLRDRASAKLSPEIDDLLK